jgi:hypothetical protein
MPRKKIMESWGPRFLVDKFELFNALANGTPLDTTPYGSILVRKIEVVGIENKAYNIEGDNLDHPPDGWTRLQVRTK